MLLDRHQRVAEEVEEGDVAVPVAREVVDALGDVRGDLRPLVRCGKGRAGPNGTREGDAVDCLPPRDDEIHLCIRLEMAGELRSRPARPLPEE